MIFRSSLENIANYDNASLDFKRCMFKIQTLHVYKFQMRKYHYASLWKLKGRSTNLQKIKIVS